LAGVSVSEAVFCCDTRANRPSPLGARGGDKSSSLTRHFFFGDLQPISSVVLGTIESGVRTCNRVDCRDGVVGYSGADANGRADGVGADGSARNLKA
jgi:hypothetical protein